jgi:TrkA domain protein
VTNGEVRIREQALPGIGHRFELDMANGRSLVVVARRDGSRDIAVREGDDDATRGTVRLARQQAVAVGSLLLGARFAEGDLAADAGAMDVGIADVTSESPVIGQLPCEIVMPDRAEAVVVAVARDDTPQLLEDDRSRPCESGDRLVVAARRDRLDDVIAYLSG